MFWLVALFVVVDRPAFACVCAAIVLAFALICVLGAIAWIGWPT